jgi:hypothetical protein
VGQMNGINVHSSGRYTRKLSVIITRASCFDRAIRSNSKQHHHCHWRAKRPKSAFGKRRHMAWTNKQLSATNDVFHKVRHRFVAASFALSKTVFSTPDAVLRILLWPMAADVHSGRGMQPIIMIEVDVSLARRLAL